MKDISQFSRCYIFRPSSSYHFMKFKEVEVYKSVKTLRREVFVLVQ